MRFIYVLVWILCLPFCMAGQKDWYFSFSPGLSYVPPMPLSVHMEGFDPVFLWADYETAPLKSPIYYSYRIGFNQNTSGWEVEMNHLKIYLRNKTNVIQKFSISHGYNQVCVNRSWQRNKYRVKVGAGVVLTHPENTIYHLTLEEKAGLLNSGYYLSGPVFQYGFMKEVYLFQRFCLILESKLSLAYAVVPVAKGWSHVPILGIHLQAGPAIYFSKKGRRS